MKKLHPSLCNLTARRNSAEKDDTSSDKSDYQISVVGENGLRLWDLTPLERLKRMAEESGCFISEDRSEGATILVDLKYVFDPSWLRWVREAPANVLTIGGHPILANCPDATSREQVEFAMRNNVPIASGDLILVPFERAEPKTNDELRKRERPFAGRLTEQTVRQLERQCYYSAYKGVTDILTKYLWPEWARVLTRVASRYGFSPNAVTAIGALFCIAATYLFFTGDYWLGLFAAIIFMVLDTVDGKLARCTITSSKFGEFFDHGIDLVHPPFWYGAWGAGLVHYGRPLDTEALVFVLAVIVIGYVLQRVIEGIFIAAYGMHVHVWRRFDSRFRLITARRNPNMIILFVALLFQRPDIGLIGVAVWTSISLLVHLFQLTQAFIYSSRGREITSWLM